VNAAGDLKGWRWSRSFDRWRSNCLCHY